MNQSQKSTPDLEKFRQFVRGIVNVPHAELKAALDAEKKAKARERDARKSINNEQKPDHHQPSR
jgi:hypothetical protein